MEKYSQYDLTHFVSRSFLEGGLTIEQALTLYNRSKEREQENHKIHAAMHGIDVDGDSEDSKKPEPLKSEGKTPSNAPSTHSNPSKKEIKPKFMFGHPEQYKNLSPEERKQKTKEAMNYWKGIFGNEGKLGNG